MPHDDPRARAREAAGRARAVLRAMQGEAEREGVTPLRPRAGAAPPEPARLAELWLAARRAHERAAGLSARAAGVRARRRAASGDGARLVAMELALAGTPRGEVERRLRAGYAITDPAPMIDEIFGAGSPDDATLP